MIGVRSDYLVIKHCSDDEDGSLGVEYDKYFELVDELKAAEAVSEGDYLVRVKWSKVLSRGRRRYIQCFGPPFIMQFSGSGLVAPCGMFFNSRYRTKTASKRQHDEYRLAQPKTRRRPVKKWGPPQCVWSRFCRSARP